MAKITNGDLYVSKDDLVSTAMVLNERIKNVKRSLDPNSPARKNVELIIEAFELFRDDCLEAAKKMER